MMPVFIQRLFRMLAERLAEFSMINERYDLEVPDPETKNCHPERGRMPESKDPEDANKPLAMRSIFTIVFRQRSAFRRPTFPPSLPNVGSFFQSAQSSSNVASLLVVFRG